MPGKRGNPSGEPSGVQKWILAELRATGPSGRVSTAKLTKRIAKSSGKRYHQNSVYTALRILSTDSCVSRLLAGMCSPPPHGTLDPAPT
jgi:hypothetical protein